MLTVANYSIYIKQDREMHTTASEMKQSKTLHLNDLFRLLRCLKQ